MPTAGTGVTRGATGAINGDNDNGIHLRRDQRRCRGPPSMPTTPDVLRRGLGQDHHQTGGKIVGYGGSTSGTAGPTTGTSTWTTPATSSSASTPAGSARSAAPPRPTTTASGTTSWPRWAATGWRSTSTARRSAQRRDDHAAQDYTGYWRIGGDNLNGWPNQPTSNYLGGAIDDVAIYPTALPLSQVKTHYTDSGRSLGGPAAPTDTYGKASCRTRPTSTGGSVRRPAPRPSTSPATSSTASTPAATRWARQGACRARTDKAVKFDGISGTIAPRHPVSNPTIYSEELWFKTTHHPRWQADRVRQHAERPAPTPTTATSTWRTPAS